VNPPGALTTPEPPHFSQADAAESEPPGTAAHAESPGLACAFGGWGNRAASCGGTRQVPRSSAFLRWSSTGAYQMPESRQRRRISPARQRAHAFPAAAFFAPHDLGYQQGSPGLGSINERSIPGDGAGPWLGPPVVVFFESQSVKEMKSAQVSQSLWRRMQERPGAQVTMTY